MMGTTARSLLRFFLLLGAALSGASSSPRPAPAPARLGCWFVEEAGGSGSVMSSKLKQHRALLVLPPPGRRMDDGLGEPELPAEVEPGFAFQVLGAADGGDRMTLCPLLEANCCFNLNLKCSQHTRKWNSKLLHFEFHLRVCYPSGTLWGGSDPSVTPLWLRADSDSLSCEINPYSPQEAHVSWAAGLASEESCPRSLENAKWFIVTIQNPEAGYGVSSILHTEKPSPWKQEATASSITTTTAVFSVFTRTPHLQSRLGQDVVLDCSFSAPAAPFSVEWRHQHRGAGRVILAYDGAAQQISVAEKGVDLFLDPDSHNVSLCLRGVGVRHEGTYICTVYLPNLHAQQALELKPVEPPSVTLRPTPLSVPPSGHAELACEVSGYYPLGVSVSWKRRSPGSPQETLLDTWESGHRQSPDGTFSLTSYARLGAVQPQDHDASYSCHVAHAALGDAELRKAVKLRVAGSSGPSLEDAIWLFLVGFVLYGILQLFFRKATGDGTKTQKLE